MILPLSKNVIKYYYQFTFKDGRQFSFTLYLSNKKLKQIRPPAENTEKPEWTRLTFYQCQICPLDKVVHPYCPLAESLREVIETFKNTPSFEEVEVLVKTPEREMYSKLPIQKALSSLLGIYMTTSNCPVMEKFAPMSRFHLPFATTEETIYRSLSDYLLAQYFVSREGKNPDWELKNLKKLYQEMEQVNSTFCQRLQHISSKDANVNALVILDFFAKNFTHSIDQAIDSIKHFFQAYLND